MLNNIWLLLVLAFENNESISLVIISQGSDDVSYRKLLLYNIPSIFASDCVKLAAMIKLIKILKTNLVLNKTTTIRDIYYQDVDIFNKDQRECSKILKELVEDGLGWSLARDFNIHPTQKGLMYGNIFKQMAEPTLIPIDYCNYFKWNTTIPHGAPLLVIVLEKDAILQSFSKFMEKASKSGQFNFIVITGKGFSDSLTRRFASWLTKTFHTTSLAFVDSDAHGILIYKQFKSAISNLKYTGMYLLESSPNSQLTISTRDISIMTNLSSHSMNTLGPKVHRELTRGLFLFKKAEMNVVSADEYNSYVLNKVVEAYETT